MRTSPSPVEEPKSLAVAVPSAKERVEAAVPSRVGYKRRVHFLFVEDDVSFFRVNFQPVADGFAWPSAWVHVAPDGVVVVEHEKQKPKEPDPGAWN